MYFLSEVSMQTHQAVITKKWTTKRNQFKRHRDQLNGELRTSVASSFLKSTCFQMGPSVPFPNAKSVLAVILAENRIGVDEETRSVCMVNPPAPRHRRQGHREEEIWSTPQPPAIDVMDIGKRRYGLLFTRLHT